MKSNKILVLGGAGYIGHHLCEILYNSGYDVTAMDSLLFRQPHPSCNEFIRGDISKNEELVKVLTEIKPDVVVNLAGIVSFQACKKNPNKTLAYNVYPNATLVAFAKTKGNKPFKIIHASSCSVYGFQDTMINEESPLNPQSLYAKSKVAAEEIINEYANSVNVRFATLFGTSNKMKFDLVANIMTANAMMDHEITVHGSGNQIRPQFGVRDAARAIVHMIAEDLRGTYNVGVNGYNMSITELAERVSELTGAKIKHTKSGEDTRNYNVDFTKLKETGFVSKQNLDLELTEIKNMVEAHGYENPMFYSVNHL